MKDDERDGTIRLRLVESSAKRCIQNTQNVQPAPTPDDGGVPLDAPKTDQDRAVLVHISEAVTPLIEEAERRGLSRLGQILELVKSESEEKLKKNFLKKH